MQALARRIAIAFYAAALCAQGADSPLPVLSVCEVLEHRNQYNGKMVAIRDPLVGTDEGMWLTATADCKYRLVTKGYTWLNAISLEFPNNGSKNPADYTDFEVDWAAINSVGNAVPKGFNPKTDEIVKTYVGLFQTYADLGNHVLNGGAQALPGGFGHLGAAPARILVKTVKDVGIIRRSMKSSAEGRLR